MTKLGFGKHLITGLYCAHSYKGTVLHRTDRNSLSWVGMNQSKARLCAHWTLLHTQVLPLGEA